ncbi:MAG: cell wall-binding repeat-containing protein [Candidatus Dormibacteria bacterium]
MRTRGRLVACAVLLGLGLPALCVGGATGGVAAATSSTAGWVTANTRVGSNKVPVRQADIPGVAVDPANPSHIVLVDQNSATGQCEYHVSFDGGATWTGGNLRAPAGFENPPCSGGLDSSGYPHMNQSVAFGSNGQVYTVFTATNGLPEIFTAPSNGKGQADSTLMAKSSDGGRTFATAVVAVPAPTGPAPMYTRPTVGVEPRATGDRVAVVAWGLLPGTTSPADGPGVRQLVTSVSNDGGSTFSTPVIASGPGEAIREPSQPVFGPDHAIYVAWTSRTGGIGTNIVVAKSADGGATWTRNAAGTVTGKGQGPNGGEAQIAIDHSTGSLYVVYQEQTPYGDQDIWFQKSTDGATTWSKPLRVNDDPTGNGIRQHVPRIAVAPNGRIDVVWLDHRNGYVAPVLPAPRGEADVYYASSSNGGATFTANRRISDRTINLDMGLGPYLGSYSWHGPVLAELGNNGVFFAWSDPRSGNVDNNSNDIYTATLHLSGAGDQNNVNELTTADNVSLAVQLSKQAYPGGGEKISSTFIANRVVLVNQNDAASAIMGAVLARSYYGPVLLTPAGALPQSVKDEIRRLNPGGVFVLGDDSKVSPAVVDELGTIVSQNVTRLGTADQVATAVAVANSLDARSAADKAAGKPAFKGAVIVNPDSPDAAAAAGFAASLRFPVLFSGRNTVPTATLTAIQSLNISSVIVVGGPSDISDNALSSLPNAKRVGGTDATSTSGAVAAEAVSRGMDTNLVYVAPTSNAVVGGVMGAAIARTGGLLVVADNPTSSNVAASLQRLQLQPDQVLVASVSKPSETPWVLIILVIVVTAVLAVAGVVMFVIGRSRSRSTAPAVTAGSG